MVTASEMYASQLSATLPALLELPRRPDTFAAAAESKALAPSKAAAGAVQVVDQVPILWNWRPTAAGVMDRALFDFCDTIPLSDANGVPFFNGSESFSDNYRTFVSGIEPPPGFPFGALLRGAVARIKEPAAGASITPPGWALVPVNGINEWRPVWSPQTSPDDWMSEVVAAEPAPRTIQFDLSGTEADSSAPSLISLLGSSLHTMSITAKAWGRIPITLGQWFTSSLVSLAASGKAFPPWETSDLFGAGGLLRFRISEFYVAYLSELSMTVSHEAEGKLMKAIGNTTELIVGGFSFAGGAPSVAAELQPTITTSSEGTTLAGRAAWADPQIVAVVVTPVGRKGQS